MSSRYVFATIFIVEDHDDHAIAIVCKHMDNGDVISWAVTEVDGKRSAPGMPYYRDRIKEMVSDWYDIDPQRVTISGKTTVPNLVLKQEQRGYEPQE